MPDQAWKEFVREAKRNYQKIGCISCPAFGGEKIYFNKYGWNHLIRKGRIPRDKIEQGKRLRLIIDVASILKNIKTIKRYRTTNIKMSTAHFWEIEKDDIHIIIRRKNTGKHHFFSVF